MKTIKGKYSKAKIFANGVEKEALDQLKIFLDSKITENCNVAVMPDVHAGKGTCIGYTQEIKNRVNPEMVGVDIGCGMLVSQFSKEVGDKFFGTEEKLKQLDNLVRKNIPMGMNNKTEEDNFTVAAKNLIRNLICYQKTLPPKDLEKKVEKESLACGSTGSGNHFIEIDKDSEGNYYVVIHTGSRHLGVEVCNYWQKKAEEKNSQEASFKEESAKLIKNLKQQGKEKNIAKELSKLKKKFAKKSTEKAAYLQGEDLEGYLHDMEIAQTFATYNRHAIFAQFCKLVGITLDDLGTSFCTIHNYVDTKNRIVRKGAISLQKDEIAIIPGSMAYGSLIVKGKGNPEWNYSGPHGFGRKYSRTKAKELFSVKEFEESMKGIFSTSIVESTLDESPMAYKSPEDIIPNLKDTCEVIKHITPIWNIKAL